MTISVKESLLSTIEQLSEEECRQLLAFVQIFTADHPVKFETIAQ